MEGTGGEGMVGCFIWTQKSHKKWMGKMERSERSRRTVNMEEEEKSPMATNQHNIRKREEGRGGKRRKEEGGGRREEEMPKEATTKLKAGGEEQEERRKRLSIYSGSGFHFVPFVPALKLRDPLLLLLPPPSFFPAMPMPMLQMPIHIE
jgi:hypothetical protein